jgi:predicted esterase
MNQETFTSTSTGIRALVWSPAQQKDNGRVILYLHGSGAFGTGMPGLFEYPDMPSLLRDGMEISACVVIPRCHIGQEWQPQIISSFLDDIDRAYGKPQHGYDLLGYSRGGHGAYQFAAAEPGRIRTLAVVATRAMPELAPKIAKLPVFICHGKEDQRTPADNVLRMHEALLAAGCNSTLALVEGDHFIIASVLIGGRIFRWQQEQSNKIM